VRHVVLMTLKPSFDATMGSGTVIGVCAWFDIEELNGAFRELVGHSVILVAWL
jgi:hypothetical protein